MDVSEKRKLLEAVDILIKRPAASNEQTIGEAMAYFKMLVEELTHKQIVVHYLDATHKDMPF